MAVIILIGPAMVSCIEDKIVSRISDCILAAAFFFGVCGVASTCVSQEPTIRSSDPLFNVVEEGLKDFKQNLSLRADFFVDSVWADTLEQAHDFSWWDTSRDPTKDYDSAHGRLVFGDGNSAVFYLKHNRPRVVEQDGRKTVQLPISFVSMRGGGIAIDGDDLSPPADMTQSAQSYLWPVVRVYPSSNASSFRNVVVLSPIFSLDLDFSDTFFTPYHERIDLELKAQRGDTERIANVLIQALTKDGSVFAEWDFDCRGKYPTFREYREDRLTVVAGECLSDSTRGVEFPSEMRLIRKLQTTASNQDRFHVIRWKFVNIDFSPPQRDDFDIFLRPDRKVLYYSFDKSENKINLLDLDPEKIELRNAAADLSSLVESLDKTYESKDGKIGGSSSFFTFRLFIGIVASAVFAAVVAVVYLRLFN